MESSPNASTPEIPLIFASSTNPCRQRSESDGGRRSGPRGPDTCSCKVRRAENASIHAHTRAQCLAHTYTHLKRDCGWPALGYYRRRPGGEARGSRWMASHLHQIMPHGKPPSLFIKVPPRFPCSRSRVFPGEPCSGNWGCAFVLHFR